MLPGQIQRITVGVVWARTTSGGAVGSLNLLKLASDKAQVLFNNNFKILDGPNAPEIEIQELESQLVMKFLNVNSTKVENYREKYRDANNIERTYKFEGYLIYQLKDATVNTGDLDNIDKARLLFQCDVKNNRGQIINKVYDPKLAALIPVEKVDGADKGVQHTFSIKNDLFATGSNTTLVDFKPVYYMVLSYAILSDDSLQIDPNQFLAGRRNIKVYKAIPHKTEPENNGTELQTSYGSGPELTRLAGRGNGGNVLEFSKETLDEILANNFAAKPKYIAGMGPVKIKVVDPLKVPNAKFEFVFKELKASLNSGLKDSMTKRTQWFMVNKTTNDTIYSDTTIGVKFESVQGRRSVSNTTNQTLADWGFSVEVEQVTNPAESALADPSNSLISWNVEWEDNGKQWLTAVADNDGVASPTNTAPWQNWIRSGQSGKGDLGGPGFDPVIHDFFSSTFESLDPNQSYEKIWNGRIAPYGLVGREKETANGRNTFGFAWSGNTAPTQNPLSEIASIEFVITPDKTKWTRAAVLEMGDDVVSNSTEGQMKEFNLRWAPSKDINGNSESSMGLSWFPGYAINMETGERLAIAFGEDSYLPGENGRDMLWNPTSKVFNDNGNYPAIGGKHFVYIFGTGLSGISRNIQGARYQGSDDAAMARFVTALKAKGAGQDVTSATEKTRLLSQVMYVMPTYLAPGYTMNDGVPPTWVKFKINIKKAYTTYDAGNAINNNRPMYEFDAASIAPKISNEIGKKNLDLVNVVPNPYRGYSEYENSPIDSRVKITNLPPTCTITIFDMAGNLIRKIKKADENTFVEWDLKNGYNVPIASGLYLIHVKADGLGEKIVRFYGIMHAIDLDSY